MADGTGEASAERADALTPKEWDAVKFVPATLSYDPAMNSLDLVPSRALRVRSLATDEAGNELQKDTGCSFTVKR